jgi:cold shock CspA family protein
MHGTVNWFDDGRGLGTIVADDGVAFPFHCTQIADGSRTIAEKASVSFDLLCKFGRYEATSIRPVDD